MRSSDKQFVAHTIQAIARCATNITEVTDTCLSGLVHLLSNRDGELIAVLQMQKCNYVLQMMTLAPTFTMCSTL